MKIQFTDDCLMDYTKATKQQLETIALHENCSVDLKFQVCRELQLRKKLKPMNLYWKSIFYICFRWW